MLNGETVCDGHLEVARCSTCWSMSKGRGRSLAKISTQVPRNVSQTFSSVPGRISTTLATNAIVESHIKNISEVGALTDRTVAISKWLYDALLLNGFPKEKLALSHSGGPKVAKRNPVETNGHRDTIRIGFLGRLVPAKGVEILISAIKATPHDVPLELIIHGVSTDQSYEKQLRNLAANDQRIKFLSPVKHEQVVDTMREFDLVAIPSQCLETGPLVLLESFAAGIPVIASNLGGIAERVRDRVDGWLLPASDVAHWSAAFQNFANDRSLLKTLKSNIQEIRTMETVAVDMAEIYRDLVSNTAKA